VSFSGKINFIIQPDDFYIIIQPHYDIERSGQFYHPTTVDQIIKSKLSHSQLITPNVKDKAIIQPDII
jgi:hypothetical protein